MDSSWVFFFYLFWIIFSSLTSCFNILFARNRAFILFFYEIIMFSFIISFIIRYFSFNIWFFSLYLLLLYFFIFVIKLIKFIKLNKVNHLNLDYFFTKRFHHFNMSFYVEKKKINPWNSSYHLFTYLVVKE